MITSVAFVNVFTVTFETITAKPIKTCAVIITRNIRTCGITIADVSTILKIIKTPSSIGNGGVATFVVVKTFETITKETLITGTVK